jgi:hypothetical protein
MKKVRGTYGRSAGVVWADMAAFAHCWVCKQPCDSSYADRMWDSTDGPTIVAPRVRMKSW